MLYESHAAVIVRDGEIVVYVILLGVILHII